jgi:predicted component of type VI protein secretion system
VSDTGRNKTVVTAISKISERPVAKEACLVVIYGLELGKKFNVGRPQTIVGRSSKADIQIDQEAVSRNHCKIINTGNAILLRDTESTNGTYVNDESRRRRASCRDGDLVKVGRAILKYLSGQQHRDRVPRGDLSPHDDRRPHPAAFNRRYLRRDDSTVKLEPRPRATSAALSLARSSSTSTASRSVNDSTTATSPATTVLRTPRRTRVSGHASDGRTSSRAYGGRASSPSSCPSSICTRPCSSPKRSASSSSPPRSASTTSSSP